MIHVCAAIICIDEKYLLTSRPAGSHLEGKWEFPGGKLKANESVYDCLIRELREELGVDIIPLDLVYSTLYTCPEKKVFLEFYRAVPVKMGDFNPIPYDGQEIKWQPRNELLNIDWVPADIPLAGFLYTRI